MYDLDTGIPGPTVIDRKAIQEKLKIVSNIIQFCVFCCAYRHAYIGNVGTDEESERVIIESVQQSLRRIRTHSRDQNTGLWENITPDMVYTKINQHIALLPNDTSKWGFFLPWLFYNALTIQLQNQRIKDNYVRPTAAGCLSKTAQIDSMT